MPQGQGQGHSGSLDDMADSIKLDETGTLYDNNHNFDHKTGNCTCSLCGKDCSIKAVENYHLHVETDAGPLHNIPVVICIECAHSLLANMTHNFLKDMQKQLGL